MKKDITSTAKYLNNKFKLIIKYDQAAQIYAGLNNLKYISLIDKNNLNTITTFRGEPYDYVLPFKKDNVLSTVRILNLYVPAHERFTIVSFCKLAAARMKCQVDVIEPYDIGLILIRYRTLTFEPNLSKKIIIKQLISSYKKSLYKDNIISSA